MGHYVTVARLSKSLFVAARATTSLHAVTPRPRNLISRRPYHTAQERGYPDGLVTSARASLEYGISSAIPRIASTQGASRTRTGSLIKELMLFA